MSAMSSARGPMSSPPTRGCSGDRVVPARPRGVLPADAGVFRWRVDSRRPFPRPARRRGSFRRPPGGCGWRTGPPRRRGGVPNRATRRLGRPGPPRRRGGVPSLAEVAVTHRLSSPPTRGYSAHQVPADGGASVLPPTRGCSGARDDRGRVVRVLPADGGAPFAMREDVVLEVSSPPTRGCSDARDVHRRRGTVLPADARVLRGKTSSRAWSASPSRRRGGVPLTPVSAEIARRSSPPTRGCSAGHHCCSGSA